MIALRWARHALHGTAVVLFVLMVMLVLAQVVARKFFEPLVWSEELARYVFIWVAFLGWIVATERRSHIAITQFSERTGARVQHVLGWLGDIGTLVLMAWLFWFGLKLVANNRDVETVTLFFNYAVVYAILPVAALAIGALTIARVRQRVRQGGLVSARQDDNGSLL